MQYLTNALIIGRARFHAFKLAAAFIQSQVVSWACPFFAINIFLLGYLLPT